MNGYKATQPSKRDSSTHGEREARFSNGGCQVTGGHRDRDGEDPSEVVEAARAVTDLKEEEAGIPRRSSIIKVK